MEPGFWQLLGLFGAFVGLWKLFNALVKMIQKIPEQTADKVVEKLREEEQRKQAEQNSGRQH